ncbi:uncharacterized protein MELLADRAFT_112869 [Melampsora larici-populina 98AG31]|uniref:Uncharacterized protein n=1 Tax=Melampsora larici-populina (strain 98AG31 / pathotype 3-4-7) TaxID=747676 RepID=F4S7Y7_MELLP|nr:uncharacterized protein MELLADRAFT_112869 [Melampsora larici-populina 98AG31]EGF99189.1 hypothetical protein MELLADRAFT_112869 [Melampsora larici-populina 98AG31]
MIESNQISLPTPSPSGRSVEEIENVNLFQKIKPNTISIFKEILVIQNQSHSTSSSLHQSLVNLNQIIINHPSSFNPTLTHYTIYPIQHLLKITTTTSQPLPSSSLSLSLNIIQHLLSNTSHQSTKSFALIEQESLILESLLTILSLDSIEDSSLLIIESSEFILSQYDQLPIRFIKPIFKSIIDLFPILSNPTHSFSSVRLIEFIRFVLLKLSISQVDPIRLITTLLPKSASHLVKLVISFSSQSASSKLVIQSIDLLEWLILFCLDEHLNDIGLLINSLKSSSQTDQDLLTISKPTQIDPQPSQVLITRDLQWLQTTISNLISLLQLLSSSLTYHPNPQIRQSWTKLCTTLLQKIPNLLTPGSSTILQNLSVSLILNQNEELPLDQNLLESYPIEFGKGAIELIRKDFKSVLKFLVYRVKDEDEVLIYYCQSIFNATETLWIMLQENHLIHHQSVLDEILEDFELIKLFKQSLQSIELVMSSMISLDSRNLNLIRFKHLTTNSKVMEAIQKMIQSFGRGLCWIENGRLELYVYEYFFEVILMNEPNQSIESLNSIWILNQLMMGTTSCMKENHQARKKHQIRMERFLKSVVFRLIDEFEQPDESKPTSINRHQTQEDIVKKEVEVERIVSYQKGMNSLPSLEKLRPMILSNENEMQETQKVLRISLLLNLFSTISTKLNTSFQPVLSILLYPILRYIDHPILSSQLKIVLDQISYETSYGNLQNMIADHLDYLVDSISSRLSTNRILPDLKAVTVMGSLIEWVGVKESFGILGEGLVQEIGEALRDFHWVEGFLEGVLDGYLRVLGMVGRVVLDEDRENRRLQKEQEKEKEEEEDGDHGLGLFVQLEKQRRRFLELIVFRNDEDEVEEEKHEKDELDRFKAWYELREKVAKFNEREEVEEEKMKRNPRTAFHREVQEEEVKEVKEEEVKDKPIGLYERVSILIVSQTLPFLSHSSNQIRKKVQEILKICLETKLLVTESEVIPLLNLFKSLIERNVEIKPVLKDHDRFGMFFWKSEKEFLGLERRVWDGFEDLKKMNQEVEVEVGFELNYQLWKMIRDGHDPLGMGIGREYFMCVN